MLTFKDGWCNSLLLSVPLIPLVRAELSVSDANLQCISVTSQCSLFTAMYTSFSLMSVHFDSSSSTFTAKFCEMDMLFQNQEIYSKLYKELPKLRTAHQGVLGRSKSDPKPQSCIWATCTEMLVILN